MDKPDYLEAGTCPECGSNAQYDDILKDKEGYITHSMVCDKCDAEWAETSLTPDPVAHCLTVRGKEYSITPDTAEQWNADNIESMTEAQALKLVDSLPAELYHPIAHAIELLRIDTPKPKPKRANCNETCN